MQVAIGQLAAHVAKGLRSLYTLHGDEPLQQQEAADAIRAAARAQGYTERTSYTVAGAHFDWSEVLAAGGCATVLGRAALARLDAQMLAQNASPGGAADLLAATLFLDRVSA